MAMLCELPSVNMRTALVFAVIAGRWGGQHGLYDRTFGSICRQFSEMP